MHGGGKAFLLFAISIILAGPGQASEPAIKGLHFTPYNLLIPVVRDKLFRKDESPGQAFGWVPLEYAFNGSRGLGLFVSTQQASNGADRSGYGVEIGVLWYENAWGGRVFFGIGYSFETKDYFTEARDALFDDLREGFRAAGMPPPAVFRSSTDIPGHGLKGLVFSFGAVIDLKSLIKNITSGDTSYK